MAPLYAPLKTRIQELEKQAAEMRAYISETKAFFTTFKPEIAAILNKSRAESAQKKEDLRVRTFSVYRGVNHVPPGTYQVQATAADVQRGRLIPPGNSIFNLLNTARKELFPAKDPMFAPPGRTKMWTDKKGNQTRLSDMTDAHLLNTIAYLNTRLDTARTISQVALMCGRTFMADKDVQDLARAELNRTHSIDLRRSLHPLYPDLMAEAQWRDLYDSQMRILPAGTAVLKAHNESYSATAIKVKWHPSEC